MQGEVSTSSKGVVEFQVRYHWKAVYGFFFIFFWGGRKIWRVQQLPRYSHFYTHWHSYGHKVIRSIDRKKINNKTFRDSYDTLQDQVETNRAMHKWMLKFCSTIINLNLIDHWLIVFFPHTFLPFFFVKIQDMPTLSTFFDGEIIGPQCTFLTRKWVGLLPASVPQSLRLLLLPTP